MNVDFEEILSILEDENPGDKLLENDITLLNFKYYLKQENRNFLVNAICNSNEDKMITYIKGLIKIYPFSDKILQDVLLNKNGVESMKENLSDWMDVSGTMEKAFNKFSTICNMDNIKKAESTIQGKIEELNKQKERFDKEYKNLNEIKKKQNDLYNEVQELEIKCAEMRKKYSEDNLKRQRAEKEKEIKALESNKRKAEDELKKLNKRLKKAKLDNNPEYEKAMKALNEAIQKLPGDEVDSNG